MRTDGVRKGTSRSLGLSPPVRGPTNLGEGRIGVFQAEIPAHDDESLGALVHGRDEQHAFVLGPLAVGDVPGRALHPAEPSPVVHDRPGIDRQPGRTPVPSHHLHLEVVHPAVSGQLAQKFQPVLLPGLDATKKVPGLADHLVYRGIAQGTGQGRIAGHHVPVRAKLENALGRMLEDVAVLGLAAHELLLHAPIGRDVPAHGLVFGQASGRVENAPHRPGQAVLPAPGQKQQLPDVADRSARGQRQQAPADILGFDRVPADRKLPAQQGVGCLVVQAGQGPVDAIG